MENPTFEEQVKKEAKQRQEMDNNALNDLLTELKDKPRELTTVEVAFLTRQLDRIERELAKAKETPGGVEYDEQVIQSEQISKLLKK